MRIAHRRNCPENYGGQERIRTSEAQVQQISSAPGLLRGLDYLITIAFALGGRRLVSAPSRFQYIKAGLAQDSPKS